VVKGPQYNLLHSAEHSKARYWKDYGKTLDIGHRGMGDSYQTEPDH